MYSAKKVKYELVVGVLSVSLVACSFQCGGANSGGGNGNPGNSSGGAAAASAQGISATRIYGQGGSFSSALTNADGLTAKSLSSPRGVAVDAGGVYIADSQNNRVLYFGTSSTTASRVYGQGGSFTSNAANSGGISAASLYYPTGVAADASGVYIVDSGNNRVLYFAGTSTTASRVYGQNGSFTTNIINNGGVSENSLYTPAAVAVNASGVYISDSANYRVLYFSGTSTTASRVYGQAGSFLSATVNNGGLSANSLNYPQGVTLDATGLYVIDYYNHRALYFSGTSTTATRVYGQSSFSTATGSTSETALSFPKGIAADSSGIYIADNSNSRVLYFSGTSTTATRVYGQSNFSNSGSNVGANGLSFPNAVTASAAGVYVVDGNNRVLFYSGTSTTATRVYGQMDNFNTKDSNPGGPEGFNLPTAMSGDASGIYVVDSGNHRVLYFAGTSTTASRVYGQNGNFFANTANNGGVSAGSLNQPMAVATDASGVYIADQGNHRILYYPNTSTTATRVYGQAGSFTSNSLNNGGLSATSLYLPAGVSVDAAGVYVADYGNHRLLFFPNTSTTATRVYGQAGSFTSGTANNGGISANSLSTPISVSSDGNGVYVVEVFNYRVLYFTGTSTTASRVYGQSGNFTTAAITPGNFSASGLFGAYGVAADANGVYIADAGFSRVLYYAGASTTASRVYGHPGFTSGLPNDGGISASSLKQPQGMWAGHGGVYVVDTGNYRVLFYP